LIAANQLRRWQAANPTQVIHTVVVLIQQAAGLQPVLDIPAPVTARHAHVLSHGQSHLATGTADLIGDLRPGSPGPHYQDTTSAQLSGVTVLVCGQLLDGIPPMSG
jgi:hypothetical protein